MSVCGSFAVTPPAKYTAHINTGGAAFSNDTDTSCHYTEDGGGGGGGRDEGGRGRTGVRISSL